MLNHLQPCICSRLILKSLGWDPKASPVHAIHTVTLMLTQLPRQNSGRLPNAILQRKWVSLNSGYTLAWILQSKAQNQAFYSSAQMTPRVSLFSHLVLHTLLGLCPSLVTFPGSTLLSPRTWLLSGTHLITFPRKSVNLLDYDMGIENLTSWEAVLACDPLPPDPQCPHTAVGSPSVFSVGHPWMSLFSIIHFTLPYSPGLVFKWMPEEPRRV